MDYLPLFFSVRNKRCIIVGGGAIATPKARLMEKAGAKVVVIAPEINNELKSIVERTEGDYLDSGYSTPLLKSLDGEYPVFVVAATNSEQVNKQVSDDCQKARIPVNVVDAIDLCTVITPAIVDRSPLTIAISSGGRAPVLVRMVRAQLEALFPANYGVLADLAGKFRAKVNAAFSHSMARRRFWERALEGPACEAVLAGKDRQATELLEKLLEKELEQPESSQFGEVYLVGAGPGDPDLLTFKALRLMQKTDVVLYDRLVSAPIMELVRRDAERVYVGKKRNEHVVSQKDINELLIGYAQQGKRVLRLKGGDPFIFGRGGEEIEHLADLNIPFQVVPGITAASGCACYSGIPLTHRDYSQSVRFITGHLKEGTTNLRWQEFVDPDQTLVFYMGLMGLQEICSKLIEHGKLPQTPAAMVEKGTTPEQRVFPSTIAELPALVAENTVKSPALLIIGEVVQLHKNLNWFKI